MSMGGGEVEKGEVEEMGADETLERHERRGVPTEYTEDTEGEKRAEEKR